MSKNVMKKNLALMLSVLFVSLTVEAQPLWVWREGGTTVHSDQPPPPHIAPSQILKSPSGLLPAMPSKNNANSSESTEPAPSNNANKNKSAAELEAEFKERQNKKTEQEKKSSEEAQKKQQSSQECERSRSYLRALQEGIRIRSTDSSVLDDAGREKEIARIQEQVKNCK